jgi:hypothetical protein
MKCRGEGPGGTGRFPQLDRPLREGGPWGKQAHPRSGSTGIASPGVAHGGPHATEPKGREAA